MKICAVAYAIYEFDGRVRRETEALLSAGHQVDVVCLGEQQKPREGWVKGAHLYRVQTRTVNEKYRLQYLYRLVKFLILSGLQLTRLWFQQRYSVIHIHNLPDFLVFAALIPKLFGAKVILDIHDVLPEFYARKFGVGLNHPIVRLLMLVERLSTGFADHVITVTEIWRKRLQQRGVRFEKCSVVLNAPDENLFPRNSIQSCKNGVQRLVYTGTLKEHSGIDIIIDALPRLVVEIPGIRLDVFGMGEEKPELEKKARQKNVAHAVNFHQAVPIEKLHKILQQADVGVDPKKSGVYSGETFSVKTMEYLAVGLPAVVSRTTSANAYYDESMVAFFKPGQSADLAERILELHQHPEKRIQQSQNGQTFFQQHNWQHYKQVYLKVVEQLGPVERVEAEVLAEPY